MVVKMRFVVTVVAVCAVAVCACAAPVPEQPFGTDEPFAVGASSTISPSTTVPSDLVATTTTTSLPVDMAEPVRLISADLGVDVRVSTESKTEGLIDPLHGEVIWVPVGDRDAGPGEAGLVLMAAHLNVGEPFYNLVDDSADDRRNGADDHGLTLGAEIEFELADGTVCRYRVIDPLGVDFDEVEQVPGQPAIYFPKSSDVMNPILARLIKDVGERRIVMMWVSYAGPDNDEWRPNGINRANNAVVFAELGTCNTPTR
jgi:hypothetical protein